MNSPQTSTEIRSCNFVINHEGRFKVMWDWIVLVLVIFTAIQIPYYAAFSTNTDIVFDIIKNSEVRPMLILSLIVDCMFVLDILLNFRTTYIQSSSDVMERNPKKLAVNYLKTWFIIDLLAAIPFDWIMHHQQQNNGRNVSLMRIRRFFYVIIKNTDFATVRFVTLQLPIADINIPQFLFAIPSLFPKAVTLAINKC